MLNNRVNSPNHKANAHINAWIHLMKQQMLKFKLITLISEHFALKEGYSVTYCSD